MKKTASSLRLLRIFMGIGVVYALWQALSFALNQSFHQAVGNLGLACLLFAVALHPTYLFGPAMPSIHNLKSNQLPPIPMRIASIGVGLAVAGVIWGAFA